MHFKAYAKIHKFKEAIRTAPDPDLPARDGIVLDAKTASDVKAIRAKDRKEKDIANLTMAFSGAAQLGLIYDAQTVEYPDGLAFLVINQLLQEHKPTNLMSRVKLRQILNKIKMKKNKNPKTV